jgi:ribose transport system ATP-binding protein
MVSEDRKAGGLALAMSVSDNLTLSSLPALFTPAALDASARRWIEKLAVRCRGPRQPVGDLSGGNQQKVAIARLLQHDVDVLLLDEPTRGIDVGSKAQIYRVIDELACQGKSVLMVSSYLPELLGVCDRIAVMCRGVLGPAHPVAETDEHRIMMEATGAAGAEGGPGAPPSSPSPPPAAEPRGVRPEEVERAEDDASRLSTRPPFAREPADDSET